MALADLAALKAAINGSGPEDLSLTCPGTVITGGRWTDSWLTKTPGGAAPTTAVVPTNNTIGAQGQQNGGTGSLFVAAGTAHATFASSIMLVDVLSWQGGLNATVTTAGVTTNLPTAALTRYTDGVGVMAKIDIWTQIGSTGSTISCSYTNQSGTSGQISPLITIGGTGFREAGRSLLIPLAAGDTGIKSIESSTLTGTTGTAGAFGYTLFKPLMIIPAFPAPGGLTYNFVDGMMLSPFSAITDDACLNWMITSSQTGTVAAMGVFELSEY